MYPRCLHSLHRKFYISYSVFMGLCMKWRRIEIYMRLAGLHVWYLYINKYISICNYYATIYFFDNERFYYSNKYAPVYEIRKDNKSRNAMIMGH
jgi:hypothetical protein